jgi:hypothetical protein
VRFLKSLLSPLSHTQEVKSFKFKQIFRVNPAAKVFVIRNKGIYCYFTLENRKKLKGDKERKEST